LGNLYATAFAASARVNLCLDHNAARAGVEEIFRSGLGFLAVFHLFATRHRDTILLQNRLGLIFVNFHPESRGWVAHLSILARVGNLLAATEARQQTDDSADDQPHGITKRTSPFLSTTAHFRNLAQRSTSGDPLSEFIYVFAHRFWHGPCNLDYRRST